MDIFLSAVDCITLAFSVLIFRPNDFDILLIWLYVSIGSVLGLVRTLMASMQVTNCFVLCGII